MSDDWDPSLSPLLRTMRIIVLALVLGASSFLGVVVFLHYTNANAPPQQVAGESPLLLYVAVLFCLGAIATRAVLPRMMDSAGRRRMAESATGSVDPLTQQRGLLQLFQTRLIVSISLLEGSAFFLLIVFMLEKTWLALALAVAMIMGIAAHIPTRDRVQTWLAEQQRLIQEERSLGGR